MEIDPVVIHEAAKKWVEAKPQPTDEVREENYPLSRLRGGHDLPLGGQTVGNSFRQIPRRPELGDVLLLDGGDHPLALRSGSEHDRSVFLRQKR